MTPKIVRWINKDEIVTDPGKFEGQRAIVEYAYQIYLNGTADIDGPKTSVEVPVAWRGADRVPCEWDVVTFVEFEDGSVKEW